MKRTITTLAFMLATTTYAQNPLVTHIYTADPTARVFNDKLYVYPSTDIVPENVKSKVSFCMPGYHLFSLEGGSTWRDHGWLLHETESKWAAQRANAMWAPDCIEKDGKFYFFYPARAADGGSSKRIGVGVSDSPEGPFEWQESYIKGVLGIDPGLMVDDKNDAYLFFSRDKEVFGVQLSDDMLSIKRKPILIEGLPEGYKEAPFPFQKDGVYYLSFAHIFLDEGFTLGYATSDNPLGPYRYQGKIMDNIETGTNHHSVVNYKGDWILFYHSWDVSGFKRLRSMRADYMHFNGDGTIPKVKPTLRGIGAPIVGDTIQIDRYNTISGAQTAFVDSSEPKGWMVCETRVGSYVTFNDVDFQSGEATKILARVSCGQRMGTIEVRDGSPEGALIASFPMTFTGGWCNWVTMEAEIKTKLTGRHNLCVVFDSEEGCTKIANLNWMMLQ